MCVLFDFVHGAGDGVKTLITAARLRPFLFYHLPPGSKGQTRSDWIIAE